MNTDIFTVEEENLMGIYDLSSRDALISGIRGAMPRFDEPEMCELAQSTLRKLDAMSDTEFADLILCPVYDETETEV